MPQPPPSLAAALPRLALRGIGALSAIGVLGALGVTPSEAGTLIVLNKAEASASLLDAETGRVVATLPTGEGPHEAAVSPDGRLCLVGDYGQQQGGTTLTLLDVPRARVLRTIDLAPHSRPHGIAWKSDGRHAWVTTEGSHAVVEVDVEAGEVVRVMKTDQAVSHMLAVSPDERRAYVANIGSGTMTVLDLQSGEKVADVATGDGAEGIDVTPDGRRVWVTNRGEDTVSVIDARTLGVVKTLPSASFPIRAKATPDGRHVLVSNAASGDVSVFDAKAMTLVRRVTPKAPVVSEGDRLFGSRFSGSSVPIGILVHPDGDRAWIAHAHGDVVSMLDLETWETTGTLTAGREPDGMAYSPHDVTRRAREATTRPRSAGR